MKDTGKRRGRRKQNKFTIKMQKKLVVLFGMLLLAFAGLSWRLYSITYAEGQTYKKQVLSQRRYDSTTLPFKRGDILDAKGTPLAVSEKVYNVILDSKLLLEEKNALEPTVAALVSQFGLSESEIRTYISEHPTSAYKILAKRLSYEEISGFLQLQEEYEKKRKESKEFKDTIAGVWFEEEYKRVYPNGRVACDAIGFTSGDNIGAYGLEEYYNDTLNGTAGRVYGYLTDDSTFERTTKAATDGNTIISTIDVNVQTIIEKYLKEFNDEYENSVRTGLGSHNAACIIMEVDTGEILGMASYPDYDLNDTRNTENLIGMPELDEKGKRTGEYLTEETIAQMDDDTVYRHLNALWKNYCIADTYEPGSTAKPFTVAAALETGAINGTEVYQCNGSLERGGHTIKCHSYRYGGEGAVSVKDSIALSCNVGLMYIAEALGKKDFAKYQNVFGFGLKTNIDLAGEARTVGLTYSEDAIGPVELATNSFGQSFNATMIQMITGFCSLINGGNYYEPHMVSKVVSPSGATIQNIEPRLLKQTISASTSEKIVEYCNAVVTDGTGKTARPAGYAIGGKTGTAETLPRGNKEYVVSFMGYAPADDPQIAIYVVVDRANAGSQDDAKYATRIVRNILTEVLPYLNIFMTEELSEEEKAELEERQIAINAQYKPAGEESTEEDGEGEASEGEEGGEGETGEGEGESESTPQRIWTTFPIDPATGYAVDPDTGDFVDPDTGAVMGGESMLDNVGAPEGNPEDDNPGY